MTDKPVLNLLLWAAALIYLTFSAIDDLKSRSIAPIWALLISVSAIIVHLTAHSFPAEEYFLIIGSAAFLFLISFVTNAAIGAGDCFVIIACSCILSFSEELPCLAAGLLGCAIWSVFLLLTKRADRKDTLPFLPFLLGGHTVVFAAELFALIR